MAPGLFTRSPAPTTEGSRPQRGPMTSGGGGREQWGERTPSRPCRRLGTIAGREFIFNTTRSAACDTSVGALGNGARQLRHMCTWARLSLFSISLMLPKCARESIDKREALLKRKMIFITNNSISREEMGKQS